MRSKWKISLPVEKALSNYRTIKVFAPSKTLFGRSFLNKRVELYNGKKFASILVRAYMIKKRMSNFVMNKYSGKGIHFKKKRKNKR